MSNGNSKTFSPQNMWSFACPIFGAEVKIKDCLNLRDQWMRGQGPEVRKGCQGCMSSSKCPIIHVIKEVDNKKDSDPYFSAEPRLGRLSDYVMKAIAPIITAESTLNHPAYITMLPRHRELIVEVNGLEGFKHMKGLAKGTTLEDIGVKERKDAPQAYKKAAPPSKTIDTTAAEIGDYAAAINAAMKDAA